MWIAVLRIDLDDRCMHVITIEETVSEVGVKVELVLRSRRAPV